MTGDQLSAGTEPVWPITDGATIVDNHVTWAFRGYAFCPSTVVGSEALFELHSKEYDMGSRVLDKLWQGMELNFLLGAAERLTLTQVVNGGRTVETIIKDLANHSPYTSERAIPQMGLGLFGSLEGFAEEFQAVAFQSSDSTRTLGKSCQLQLVETAGVVIPITTDAINITVTSVITGLLTDFAIDLPLSYYENTLDLLDAVIAALNADADLMAAMENNQFSLLANGARLGITNTNTWGTQSTTGQFLWSLLGFGDTTTLFTPAAAKRGLEIPYDVVVGGVGLAEATIRYRGFRRRPSP